MLACAPPSSPKGHGPALAAAALFATAILAAAAVAVTFVGQGGWPQANRGSLPLPALATSTSWRPQPQDSRLEVVRGCSNFACLRVAHALPHSPGEQFNFPHFIIAGYPKCATSSLTWFFGEHPQVVRSTPKEPHFFTANGGCTHPNSSAAWGCDQQAQQTYLLDIMHRDEVANSGLTRAAFEASVHYAMAPAKVVAGMWRELPWLRVVLTMREPLSQKVSSIVHWGEMMMRDPRPAWMDTYNFPRQLCSEQLFRKNASMYDCLLVALGEHPELQGEYHANLPTWLDNFPREQFYVVQYENLTANTAAVLTDLQLFLGLDPSLGPTQLPEINLRKVNYKQGWPMKRHEYEHLLSIARPRAEQLAALLEQHGFVRAKEWLAPWEAAWKRNLGSCNAQGDCVIQPS